MRKQIKSFTIDGEVYSSLVSMFQRYKTGVSISLYVNKMLENLLADLKELEEGLNGSSLTVTMDYIINKMVTGSGEQRLKYPEGWKDHIRDEGHAEIERDEFLKEAMADAALEDWQIRYDAEKKGVPYELYKYAAGSTFRLSSDNRYLIGKDGEKYFPVGGSLMRLVKEEK